jgi:hypothetical protein
LSQLGRAIVATSTELDNNEYRLSRLGISDQLNGAASQGLTQVPVRGEGKGAFPVVAKALKASPMSQEVALGDLWGLLPDAERFPLPGSPGLQRLKHHPESPHINRASELARGQLYPLPIGLQISDKDPSVGCDVIPDEEMKKSTTYSGITLSLIPLWRDGAFQIRRAVSHTNAATMAPRLGCMPQSVGRTIYPLSASHIRAKRLVETEIGRRRSKRSPNRIHTQ